MSKIKKVDLRSMKIDEDKRKSLKQVFPEVFSEGKIDFEKLKLILGETVEVGKDRYNFTWAGKSDVFKIIQEPSIGTLKPVKNESVNFDKTENLFIEGDNLEVLKLLQKSYYGKVKMIYIDPPYNTGNDFIYPDDFKENLETYLKYTGQVDSEGRKFSTNTDRDGRFHSKWLNMMYPRLYLAKNLLRDDGVIFISIDDNEVANLRKIMDEIFGEENFIAQIVWKSKYGAGAKTRGVIETHEYVICYIKSYDNILGISIPLSDKLKKIYNKTDDKFENRGSYGTWPLETTSMDNRPNLRFPISYKGEEIWPKKQWLWSKERVEKAMRNDELVFNKGKEGKWSVRFKGYMKDEYGNTKQGTPISVIDDIYTQDGTKELTEIFPNEKIFDFPKPNKLIKKLLLFKLNSIIDNNKYNNDIVLDFFSGSCTTAHAVFDLNKEDGGNRKFICVQLPEPCPEDSEAFKAGYKIIAEIGKERIRRVIKKIKEEKKQLMLGEEARELDLGFKVFKLEKSNFRIWDGVSASKDKESLIEQLELHISHIDSKATGEDLLYELLLKSGFKLTTKIEKLTLAGKTVYSIEDGAMLIYLEKHLTKELIKAMAEKSPARVICLDESFEGNDQLKTNAAQIMKSKNIDDFRTV